MSDSSGASRTERYELRQSNERQVLFAGRLKVPNECCSRRQNDVTIVYLVVCWCICELMYLGRSGAVLLYRWALGGRLNFDRQVRQLFAAARREREREPHDRTSAHYQIPFVSVSVSAYLCAVR